MVLMEVTDMVIMVIKGLKISEKMIKGNVNLKESTEIVQEDMADMINMIDKIDMNMDKRTFIIIKNLIIKPPKKIVMLI